MTTNRKLKLSEFNEGSVELGPEELDSKDTKVRRADRWQMSITFK